MLLDCRSVVFGAIDGIVTAVCVAAATVGANLGWRITLCITISVVTASSISMGISEFLSSKAHKEYLLAEKRKELWEFKNFRDQEVHHVSAHILLVYRRSQSKSFSR